MAYEHTQKSPLYLILIALAGGMSAMAWQVRAEAAAMQALLAAAVVLVLIALMFKHLTIRDGGESLIVRFGPLPPFGSRIRYADISEFAADRTKVIDGWGIHWIPGRGYTYNLWGFDCVRLVVNRHVIRLGTDDVQGLIDLLVSKTES